MKTKLILHGEAMVFQSRLPTGAKKINPSNQRYHIIADSEMTGNHHVVDCGAGVQLFEDNGIIFMENDKPTSVRCLLADRHDTIELPAGTWEFGTQKEYDHFAQNLIKVRD